MRQIRTAEEARARTEAPRGEVFYYIRTNGTDMPLASYGACLPADELEGPGCHDA